MDQKEQGFDIEGVCFSIHFVLFHISLTTSQPCFATDEEVFFEHNNSSPEDEEFDTIVSALEEILQDDSFQALLNSFYQDNCGQ